MSEIFENNNTQNYDKLVDEYKVENVKDEVLNILDSTLKNSEIKEKIDWKKLKIIIAEDDISNKILLKRILTIKWIKNIIFVTDWLELIIKLLEKDENQNYINNFDLIVSDIKMWWGERDWDKAFSFIKNEMWDLSPKFLSLTANAMYWEKDRLLDLWFDWYISKPFAPIDLINHIELLFE